MNALQSIVGWYCLFVAITHLDLLLGRLHQYEYSKNRIILFEKGERESERRVSYWMWEKQQLNGLILRRMDIYIQESIDIIYNRIIPDYFSRELLHLIQISTSFHFPTSHSLYLAVCEDKLANGRRYRVE